VTWKLHLQIPICTAEKRNDPFIEKQISLVSGRMRFHGRTDMEVFGALFSSGDFMPHGYCYLWQPGLVWLHVISDSLIALAYCSIPFALVYFIRKRKDVPFNWIFMCFGTFILACGATHAMEVWNLWHADYWLSGAVKALTAIASVPTAILLVLLVPRALALPGPEAMRLEIAERKRAQEDLDKAKNELEVRVQERTAKLQKANDDLVGEIFQRNLAEEALRRSEEQVRMAQAASGSASWDWNPQSDLATWSEKHYQIFGLDPTDIEQSWASFLKLVHPADRARVQLAILTALKADRGLEVEYRINRPDGQARWVMTKGKTYCDSAGEPIRMVGLTMDITDRKQLEQALLKTQSELAHLSRVLTMGELTSSIAHEVNQPLVAVVLNGDACLRWLAVEPPNLDKVRESVASMVKEGKRAGEIIKGIRALAKNRAPQKTELPVNDLIAEVINLAATELSNNQVSLRTEFAPDLPAVYGDRVQLQQVILNLIANGIDAMKAINHRPRELSISSQASDDSEVLITVRDCGTGVEPRMLENIFKAFFTTKNEGIGLGLSISRTIVEAHGGRMWVLSNSDHGATFQFTLPRVVGAHA
jgi:PAS domain S-box-containing protein